MTRAIVFISNDFYRSYAIEDGHEAAFHAGFLACTDVVGGGADMIGLYIVPGKDERWLKEQERPEEIAKAMAATPEVIGMEVLREGRRSHYQGDARVPRVQLHGSAPARVRTWIARRSRNAQRTGVLPEWARATRTKGQVMNTLPTELVESIRVELLKLVQAPDIDKNLVAIGKLSQRARDLFMVLKNPEAAMKSKRGYQYGDESESSEGPNVMGMPNGSSETFGAKAIREIIGALPGIMNAQNETPSSLVIAASIARDRGMTDLSAEIERKLIGRTLDGDRPVDKERMRDIVAETTPEGLKARYLGAAGGLLGGAIGVIGAGNGVGAATPIPPEEEEGEESSDEQTS